MVKLIGGILAGLALLLALLGLFEFALRQTPLDWSPAVTASVVAVSYFLATLAGAALAARIARRHLAAWIVALLVTAGAAYTIGTVPQAFAVQPPSILAPLLAGAAAPRLVRAEPAPKQAEAA